MFTIRIRRTSTNGKADHRGLLAGLRSVIPGEAIIENTNFAYNKLLNTQTVSPAIIFGRATV